MNEETMNMEMRKVLKKFGVTSQQQIEHAIFKAVEEGRLTGSETLDVILTLEIPGLDLTHTVKGTIKLE